MDQITLLFAAMLASLQQLPSHSSVPAASVPLKPVAAQTVQKKLAPPHGAKSEHACPDFGKPDAHGNPNYCFNNN